MTATRRGRRVSVRPVRLSPFGIRTTHAAGCDVCQTRTAPTRDGGPVDHAVLRRLFDRRSGEYAAGTADRLGRMVCDDRFPWTGNGAAFPSVLGRLPIRPASSSSVAIWRADVALSSRRRRILAASVRRIVAARASQWTEDGRRIVFAVSSSGVAVRVPSDAARRLSSGASYPIGGKLPTWTASGVTEDDAARLRSAAWKYCRTVDASRSRKRSADVADDVASDALLLFGANLRRAAGWPVVAYADDVDGASDDWQVGAWSARPDAWTADDAARAGLSPVAWEYVAASADDDVVRDCDVIGADDDADDAPTRRRVVTRATLRRWAIVNAARRNGFRLDVAPSDVDATPDARQMRPADRGVMALTSDTRVATLSTSSAAAWESVWSEDAFPVLSRLLFHASDATHSGRASGVWQATTSDVTGTATRNSRHTSRVRDAALSEWSVLRDRLDVVRDATTARVIDV